MAVRQGIRAFDKQGKQGYVISHSDKIFYPDKNSVTGLTTLSQALGMGQFRFESNINLDDNDEIGEPVVDPLVADYINKILSSFITEVVTIKGTDWVYDGELDRYKVVFAYPGMKAGIYPSYGLVPSDLLPSDLELAEFDKIDYLLGQEDSLVFISKTHPNTSLDIVIKGIMDYGGLDANLETMESKINELKVIIDESKPQFFSKEIYSYEWESNYVTIYDSSITVDSYVEVLMDPDITEAEYKQLIDASIVALELDDNQVTLKALGTVPTINIPIILKITK